MSSEVNKDLNGLVLASSLASIAASIYLFTKGSKETGIFVGLWAPTFLGLGSLYRTSREDAAKPLPSTP